MNSKLASTLGATLPILVASSALNAAPPKMDLEPPEVDAFLAHAERIVGTIKSRLKHCRAEDDTISCMPKSAPPMTCTYETENHLDSLTVRRGRLTCETSGKQFGIEMDTWYGPWYPPRLYDSPEVGYLTMTSGEFEIWPPSHALWPLVTCMAAFQKPDNNLWIDPWQGCTQVKKNRSRRVNRKAIDLLNRAGELADEAKSPEELKRHYGFVTISASKE